MLEIAKNAIKNLDTKSAILILTGLKFCCTVITAALLVSVYNDASGFSIATDALCKTTAVTVCLCSAEFIIGGLALDCYSKSHR